MGNVCKKPPPPFAKGDERTREIARRGAEKANRVRREKKALRECAIIVRDMPWCRKAGADTMGMRSTIAMFRQAIKGDSRAYRVLAELMGEMEEQIAIKEIPKMIDDI